MVVSVPIERRRVVRFAAPTPVHQGHLAEWKMALTYSASELRSIDVVPAVLGFMTQIAALKPHQGALFLIFSELFNNALDHGLLQLDSGIKSQASGFDLYMQQRAERLARLESGRIELAFRIHEDEGQAVLDMEVADSGAGFDFDAILAAGALEPDEARPHGRGIALVRSLCASVLFTGTGNRVQARSLL